MTTTSTSPFTTPSTRLGMLSTPSMVLLIYGGLMLLAFIATFVVSLNDARTIRDVGIWIKPMKFMAATTIFAWTSVWVVMLSRSAAGTARAWGWIAALLISTSLFEVIYITYQATQGGGSHYNTSTPLIGLLAVRFAGKHAKGTLVVCAVLYALLWVVLTGFSFVGIP
jgi:hypothetical protein